MLDILSHLAKAKRLPDLAPEVAYEVRPSFFYGSFNKPKPGDLREQSVSLINPRFVRKQQALSLQVERNEPQLLRYYTEVLRAIKQHRREMMHCSSYFALRPLFLSAGQTAVAFPWYDTYPATAGLLRALQQPLEQGLLFHDADQGWEVAIYAQDNRVYLAEGDGDQTRPYGICYTDRARLSQLAAATLTRVQQQLALFVRETGQNPWRYRAE